VKPAQLLLLPPARPLAERFGAEFFRNAPERPGVYLMCGRESGVLYVGKARNLRRRLAAYRSAQPEAQPRKLSRMLALVERIHWDECPDEAAAVARERELLLALQPRFNTVGVRPARKFALGWTPGPTGVEFGTAPAAREFQSSVPVRAGAAPAHAALLRLVWAAARPELPLADMPRRLVVGRPAPVCRFASPDKAFWAGLAARLEVFFAGDDETFTPWLAARRPHAAGFEAAWLALDAERAAELAGAAKTTPPPRADRP
jgi:predicted GIY-YIG superfamily endonuclease